MIKETISSGREILDCQNGQLKTGEWNPIYHQVSGRANVIFMPPDSSVWRTRGSGSLAT